MKLTCSRCGHQIDIPPEAIQQTDPRVQCGACGARYKLKPNTGAPPIEQVRTASDLHATSATPSPTSPPPAPLPPLPHDPTLPQSAYPPPAHPPSLPAAPADAPTVRTPDPASIIAAAGSTAHAGHSTAQAYATRNLPIFKPGDLLAERYRIVRFLAQGGMGEVYAAEDVELRQEVALKTVSAQVGQDPSGIDRFKREVALARRVTHPNVCRIFDLGTHRQVAADGSVLDTISFLTMELLRGETLSSRLRRTGRLAVAEALPLVRQMAAALAAAHDAKVIHRDFKSENVFLVPHEGTSTDGGLRAVVTDFGIARGSDAGDRFAAQVTGLGIVGTPAYMAPEQVENAPEITVAADIYALGIVIYEMVTGKLPFESTNPLTAAVKRLQEAPPPPHVHVPDLPAPWERAILKCLQRRPTDRYDSVLDVAAALEPVPRARPATDRASAPADARASLPAGPRAAAQTQPAPTPLPATSTQTPASKSSATATFGPQAASVAASDGTPRRTRVLLAVLMLIIFVSGALWWVNKDDLDPSKVRLRPSVAVLGFDNVTGREESAWVEDAIAEMLSVELGRQEGLRSIPSATIDDARRQLKWTPGGSWSADDLKEVRTLVGCDYAVSGSFVGLPGAAEEKLRLDVHVLDTSRGETVAQFTHQGTTGDLFEIVAAAGTEILAALGRSAEETGSTGLPENRRAAKLFVEGSTALGAFQAERARELFEQAVTEEPGNALLHSALSSTWNALGFPARAAQEASKAFELSKELNRETRLLIEGRHREMQGDWTAAREVYRTLWVAFPDELDYGLGLVSAQLESGDPGAALLTLDQLRRLPAPLSEDPRLDMKEAEAGGAAGQIERQAGAAERAVEKAEALGSDMLAARALLTLSQAERLLGDSIPAVSSATSALDLFRSLGHEPGQAEALTALADAELDRGRVDEARQGFREALEIYRRLGYRGGQAALLNNLAVLQKRAGDLDDALNSYGQAETIYREVGRRRGIALAINNRGVIFVARDRLAEAESLFKQAADAWKDDSGPAKAFALNNLAEVARLQGRFEESRNLHEQALDLRRQAGLRLDEVVSLVNLGLLDLWNGELDAAQARLDEALKQARDMDDPFTTSWALFAYGELQREQGAALPARDLHQEAFELRRGLGQRGLMESSRIALARIALESGEPAEAVTLAEEARLACRLDSRRAEELEAAAVLIEALTAQGSTAEAQRILIETSPLVNETEQPVANGNLRRAAATLQARNDPGAALEDLRDLRAELKTLEIRKLRWEVEVDTAILAGESASSEEEAAYRRLAQQLQRRGYLRLHDRLTAALP